MIRCPCFDYKTATTHIYLLLGFHLGKLCPKIFIGVPKHSVTDVTKLLFNFFNNSQDLSENINITLFISLFKHTATWREEVLSSGGSVFWNHGGNRSFFHISNSALRMWHGKYKSQDRYKTCSKNNYLHTTLNHEIPNDFICFQFTQSKENLSMFIYNMIFFHQLAPSMC